MVLSRWQSVVIRRSVSYRRSELYKLKRRTELVSTVLDQHNYLPIRPLDGEERPGWSNPVLRAKETMGRLKCFSVARQYAEFKQTWKDTFQSDYNETKTMEELFQLYQTYCNAIATESIDGLLEIATVDIYKLAKQAIDSRPKFDGKRPLRLQWSISKVCSLPSVSNAVCTTLNESARGLIAGISVRFHTIQEIHAVVGNNLGIPEERVLLAQGQEIRDHIVFVRDMLTPFRGWKIAGISEAADEYYTNPTKFQSSLKNFTIAT